MASQVSSRSRVRGMLLVSLVRIPEAGEWTALREEILHDLRQGAVGGVVLDLSRADVLDDVDLGELLGTQATVRLMGRDLVLSGLRPEVVHAWVRLTEIPVGLRGFTTVEDALTYLLSTVQS